MIKLKNQTIFFILYLLLFIIILQGISCQPNIDQLYLNNQTKILPFEFCKNNFFTNFWQESGFVENLQSIFLLLSIILLIQIKNQIKNDRFYNFFLFLHILCLIYYLGEEISWGQHIFKWESSEIFTIYNTQKETNIHNISNLFDQLPRTFVLIWCALSIPIILFINKFIKIKKNIFKLICPNSKLISISYILLFFAIPDLVIDKLNIHPGWLEESKVIVPHTALPLVHNDKGYYLDLVSFNFVRLSELQELIFSFYFFLYALLLKRSYSFE